MGDNEASEPEARFTVTLTAEAEVIPGEPDEDEEAGE